MLHIDIITCLPGLLEGPFAHSIISRAVAQGKIKLTIHDLRAYGIGKHRQIDDKPYGGGAGMVLMVEPIVRCIEALKVQRSYDEIIYMSPDGALLDQSMANALSLCGNLMILCGHYKGVDERIRTHFVTREVSVGHYVLTGGELPAAVVVDAVVRLLPGVLSDESSALSDSFQDDGAIAPPVYTRPASFRGLEVPAVLRSGHAAKIAAWREEESAQRTLAHALREGK